MEESCEVLPNYHKSSILKNLDRGIAIEKLQEPPSCIWIFCSPYNSRWIPDIEYFGRRDVVRNNNIFLDQGIGHVHDTRIGIA